MKSLTELSSEHKCHRDFGKMERVRPRIRFSTFATLHKEFLILFLSGFYHSYSI